MAMIGARRPFDLNAIPSLALPSMPAMAVPTVTTPPAAPKPHFFGQGGVGRGIAGNIGDFLLQLAHMQPIYGPAMQQQTAFERGEQQYKLHRLDALSDDARNFQQQLDLKDYDRTHPNPYRFRSNDGSLRELDPVTGTVKTLFKDPAPKMFTQVIQGTNGPQLVSVPMPGTGEDEGEIVDAPPAGAVPLGGQTPPASGGFPGGYF